MALKRTTVKCLSQVAGWSLLAVALYLAGVGPAWSVAVRFPKAAPILGTFFDPLPAAIQGDILKLWCRVDKRVLETLNHVD
jgi:hypothetical protein